MKKLSIPLFACMAFMFIACEEEVVPDTKAPTVLISSPSEGDEFGQQDDITFTAAVTDDSELASVFASITPPDGEAQVVYTEKKENFTNGSREASINRTFSLGMSGGLAPGSYLLTIHASDVQGNATDESVGIIIIESDTEAPVITFSNPTAGAEFNPDEEVSVEAAVTDGSGLSSLSISLTPPGGEAQVVHTEDFTDKVTTEASINEPITFEATAEAGDYVITIETADTYGNTHSESRTISLRERDTSAPTIAVSNPTEGAEFISDEAISIEARATDNVALGSYSISITPPNGEAQVVHSKEFSANSTEATVSETISLAEGATAGNYMLTLEVRDAAGNSADKTIGITVNVPDAEAPAITIHTPAEGAAFTTDEAIPVRAVLTDDTGLATASISITDPDGQVQDVYSETFTDTPTEAEINQTISLGNTPATGNYVITVKATDLEGNTRDKSVNIIVREPDHTAPTVNISAPSAGMEFYANEAIQLQANATDNAGLEEVIVWVSAPSGEAQLVHTENPDNFLNNGTEATIDQAIGLGVDNPAAGTYIISVRARDAAGNTTEENVSIIVLEPDTNAPTITVYSPEEGSSFEPGGNVVLDALVEDDTRLAEIRVKITLGRYVTIYDETTTEFDSDTSHKVNRTATIPADAVQGTYYVTITATDAAGNRAKKELSFQVTN